MDKSSHVCNMTNVYNEAGGSKFGPRFSKLGHCLEKKDRDPFPGPSLGFQNGVNFANKLLSEFKEKAGKPAANCQYISTVGSPHELFTPENS